jgi:hypothetical protein
MIDQSQITRCSALSLFLLLGVLVMPAMAANDQQLFAPDGASGDAFSICATEGTTLVVGTPNDDDHGSDSGSVNVFTRGTGGTWAFAQKPNVLGLGTDDGFGGAVALSGDTMIVGAPGDDDGGSQAGAAYVFQRFGSTWLQTQKLLAENGMPNDRFGTSVAIQGDMAVIGAYNASGQGRAYVFQRIGNWQQVQQLSSNFSLFGFSCAMGGDRIAVGGYDSVALYRREGNSFVAEASLTSPSGADTVFGISVGLDTERLVVGAWLDDQVAMNAGAAFVYRRQGTTWIFEQKLIPFDGGQNLFFGGSVAIHGERVLVGCHADDDQGQNSGSAYVFAHQSNAWVFEEKLLATNGQPMDGYGTSVALTQDEAFCGASGANGAAVDTGAVFVSCFPEPMPELFDLVPGRVFSTASAPGQLDVRVDYSLLQGGDVQSPQLDFHIEVHVNGVLQATEPVTEFLSPGIPACYTSSVPCVNGGCPGALRCVWVALPNSSNDFCACEWVSTINLQVPGQPGDLLEVVIDPGDTVEEVREENNYVLSTAADIGTNYCMAGVNTSGQEASIAVVGSALVSENVLSLVARGLPSSTVNLFFMGGAQNSIPFGDGFLCAGAPTMRIPPPTSSNSAGYAQTSLDLTSPAWANVITPGSQWNFQNWYRDAASPAGFNLTDGSSVQFATGNTVPQTEIVDESAFIDPNAVVVGAPVSLVADMIGSQMFLNTDTNGRILVELQHLELFTNSSGFMELGYLAGTVVWGDAPFEDVVIDRLAQAFQDKWQPLTSLSNFQMGIPGSQTDISVEQMLFHRVQTNDYVILTVGELHGFDNFNQTVISQVAPGAVVLCASFWEWRCINTACAGSCNKVTNLPGGRVRIDCECQNVGGCTNLFLPNCMRVSCATSCRLFGWWDLCDC